MQRFKYIIGLIILSTFFNCAVSQQKIAKQSASSNEVLSFKAEKNKKGDSLPSMNFLTANKELKFDTSLVKGKPVLFVLFNPGCSHCKQLCAAIRDSIDLFKGANILYLAGEPNVIRTKPFAEEMKVLDIPNFIVASDNSMITTQVFEYMGIPQIMIYNKEWKLQHIYYKDASVKQILPILLK